MSFQIAVHFTSVSIKGGLNLKFEIPVSEEFIKTNLNGDFWFNKESKSWKFDTICGHVVFPALSNNNLQWNTNDRTSNGIV